MEQDVRDRLALAVFLGEILGRNYPMFNHEKGGASEICVERPGSVEVLDPEANARIIR